MKQNIFEMGAKFESDGLEITKEDKSITKEIKPKKSHQLVFLYEKRRGKPVTIVKPFFLEKKELQATLKHLKKKLAVGGTIFENTIEIQGDKKEQIKQILLSLDFRFKG